MPTIETKQELISFWTRPAWLLQLFTVIMAGAFFVVLAILTGLMVWWQAIFIAGSLLLLIIGVLCTVKEIQRINNS